jgi:hypothetical protein
MGSRWALHIRWTFLSATVHLPYSNTPPLHYSLLALDAFVQSAYPLWRNKQTKGRVFIMGEKSPKKELKAPKKSIKEKRKEKQEKKAAKGTSTY